MTVGTGISRLAVIKRLNEVEPTRTGSMAQITGLGAEWVRSALTRGYRGIMAIGAGIGRLTVIKGYDHRYPHIGDMAHITLFAGDRMGGGFIGSSADSVVTAGTVTGLPRHCAVIKQYLKPIGGVMAHVAGLSGWYVSGTFASGNSTVVAVLTKVHRLTMINGNNVRLPSRPRGMTSFA